jgi:hypothetical protein
MVTRNLATCGARWAPPLGAKVSQFVPRDSKCPSLGLSLECNRERKRS